jgi:integrase/recombinase XerC
VKAVLDRFNVTIADLVATPQSRQPARTFAEYTVKVFEAMKPTRTRDTYRSYWRKLVKQWPDKRIDDPTVTDLEWLVNTLATERAIRRGDRGGLGVAYAVVNSLRCLYKHAVNDDIIDLARNPALKLDRQSPPPAKRRAIQQIVLNQIYDVIDNRRDPSLHRLLVRLHLETASRRAGVLGLRPEDLNREECLIRLREKGGTERWQPVSSSLMAALCEHHAERMPPATGGRRARNGRPISDLADRRLLRYASGDPITVNVYDCLWGDVKKAVPTAASLGLSIHWLRHTTLKWVERNFSVSVAKAYAGHADNHSQGAITIYTIADIEEVAEALSWLTGEQHPLAPIADYSGALVLEPSIPVQLEPTF